MGTGSVAAGASVETALVVELVSDGADFASAYIVAMRGTSVSTEGWVLVDLEIGRAHV